MLDLPPVPLRSWRLRNFKSVRSADIDLAHLNVLVGANSSGKSSLIQSILAASQAATASPGETFPLNGPLVRLGEFRDLLHANLAGRGEVSLGGSIDVEPAMYFDEIDALARTAPLLRRFRPGSKVVVNWSANLRPGPKHAQGSAVVRSVQLEVDGRYRVRLNGRVVQPSGEVIDAFHRFGLSEEAERAYTLGFAGRISSTRPSTRVDFHGVSMRGGIPVGTLELDQTARLLAQQWLESLSNMFRQLAVNSRQERQELEANERREEDEPTESMMSRLVEWAVEELTPLIEVPLADSLIELRDLHRRRHRRLTAKEFELLRDRAPDFIDGVCGLLGEGEQVLHPASSPEMATLRSASFGLIRFLSQNVRYLGPLREDPQVVYRSAGSVRTGDIGPKGEFAAAVLHARALQTIRMPTPNGGEEPETLQSALNFWLSRIGAAQEISTEDRGALGYDMRVRQSGLARTLDLTSVGVGVSQLLPVLMMCLLSDPGDLLLLEQPELHLHPALQQDLADFLLACAKSGRQLIVETHSEYLVSRLRRRIAEDRSDQTLTATQFLFVERDPDSGSTRYRPVPTNRYGGIEDWPRDFFAQTPIETQEILRKGLRKSEDDSDMTVGFVFRTQARDSGDSATELLLEQLSRHADDLADADVFIDLGPLLGQHEVSEERTEVRSHRATRYGNRVRASGSRERLLRDLSKTIGWRSGSIEEFIAQSKANEVFMIRIVGVPLDVAESIDAGVREGSDDYVGAYEFVPDANEQDRLESEALMDVAATTAENIESEVDSTLVRRFAIRGSTLTILRVGLSSDDVIGVMESWRRADLFKEVVIG